MTISVEGNGDAAALVAAAGAGVRLGPGAPKALRELGGESLLAHTVRRLFDTPDIGCVVVAAPASEIDHVRQMLGERPIIVSGGKTRQESVARALAAVPKQFQIILVHDAARALTPPSLITRVVAAVRGGVPAVVPVLPVVDTVKRVDEHGDVLATVNREDLRIVQTPQGFRRDVLVNAHAHADSENAATDDAGLVERVGGQVRTVVGDELAMKITRPLDMKIAEALL